jgi:chlorobactene glucosyltransferase
MGVLLVIAFANALTFRRLESFPPPASCPPASILVPARNEARNITSCLRSLLAQDYPAFEVLVLDDASTDGTGDLAHALAAQDHRLRVIPGRPLPAGWLGKHWACHQLAEAAGGDLWLFTDADTVHHPCALRDAVAALCAESVDLVTALPRQAMPSWGERLVVSLLPWSLFSFFPLALAQRLRWPPLVVAVGQFMLFRPEAYRRLGGYAAVRAEVADDIALARRLVDAGGRWRLLDASRRVTCRMYTGFGQAFQGFSKNLFAAFGRAAIPYAFIWLWLGLVFLAPLVQLALWPMVGQGYPALSLAAIALSLGLWGLCAFRLRLPSALPPIYPLILAVALVIAVRSFILTRSGKAVWKERLLPAPR